MKYIMVWLLMLVAAGAKAQLAVRLLHFNPTGDQGILFEKRFTAEIMYMQDFANEGGSSRMRAGISYTPLKSRLDTFPSYAVQEGSGTLVLPGYEIYKKYDLISAFMGADWAVLDREPFYLFLGGDIMGGVVNMEYEANYETILDESFSGGLAMVGIRLRAGTQYMITDKVIVFGEVTRSYYYIEEYSFQSHYDYGIGIQYVFN